MALHYSAKRWQDKVVLLIGAWVAVSPWLLDIVPDRTMTTSLLVSGLATVVLGLWELRSDPELHSQSTKSGVTG